LAAAEELEPVVLGLLDGDAAARPALDRGRAGVFGRAEGA
jgi:hypothetical protein